MELNIRKIHKNSKTPTKATSEAAGFDLYSIENVKILPKERKLIKTGIEVEIPKNHFGHITGRSSLSKNFGIVTVPGVIDSDYRGEIKALLINTSEEPFEILAGMRFVQMLIIPVADIKIKEFDILPTTTTRGSKGFGSSGFF